MGYSANADIQDLFDQGPLRAACRRITHGMLDQLHRGVVARTPVSKPPPGIGMTQFQAIRGRLPGTLRGSWETTDVDEGVSQTGTARFSGEEFTMDPIAPHVEWPTRPHTIRPSPLRRAATVVATRRARRSGTDPMARLRFINAQGRVVYAAEVHHPGTQGKHMMRDSLAEVDASWPDTVGAQEMARWAREQAALVR